MLNITQPDPIPSTLSERPEQPKARVDYKHDSETQRLHRLRGHGWQGRGNEVLRTFHLRNEMTLRGWSAIL